MRNGKVTENNHAEYMKAERDILIEIQKLHSCLLTLYRLITDPMSSTYIQIEKVVSHLLSWKIHAESDLYQSVDQQLRLGVQFMSQKSSLKCTNQNRDRDKRYAEEKGRRRLLGGDELKK